MRYIFVHILMCEALISADDSFVYDCLTLRAALLRRPAWPDSQEVFPTLLLGDELEARIGSSWTMEAGMPDSASEAKNASSHRRLQARAAGNLAAGNLAAVPVLQERAQTRARVPRDVQGRAKTREQAPRHVVPARAFVP